MNQESTVSSSCVIITTNCLRNVIDSGSTSLDTLYTALEELSARYTLYCYENPGSLPIPVDIIHYFATTIRTLEMQSGLEDTENIRALPRKVYLVSNDYSLEILPSIEKGWKTIWVNPTCDTAPGLLPLNWLDVQDFTELPEKLANTTIPEYQTCLSWLLEKDASVDVLTHVHMVAGLAYTISCKLHKKDILINPLLVHRAGLLHDLAKIRALQSDIDHGTMGAQWLLERNLPEIAEITRRHVLNAILDPLKAPRTWDEKIIFYTDKIVNRSELVPIELRIKSLAERYPLYSDEINQSLIPVRDLQDEICSILGTTPEELLLQLAKEIYSNQH